jgi:hypothetical protein
MQNFRMPSLGSAEEATFEQTEDALNQLGFTTGNSSTKLQVLDVFEDFIDSADGNMVILSRWIRAIRMFVFDWDRQVRTRAFRLLRYLLDQDSEELFINFSIHKLVIIRLESSKSPHERVSVLRLIGLWIALTRNSELVSSFYRSLTAMVTAHTAPLVGIATDFYSTILQVILAASTRFPNETLGFLVQILNTSSSRFEPVLLPLLLDRICGACSSTNSCVQLSSEIISNTVISHLSKSNTGISILHHSLTSQKVIENSRSIAELINNTNEWTPLFESMLRQVPDLGPALIHSAFKSLASSPSTNSADLSLLSTICPPGTHEIIQKTSWRFPEWFIERVVGKVHEVDEVSPSWLPLAYPGIPEYPNRSYGLSPEQTQLVSDILELISSVQFKSRSHALTTKRQQDPKLFQSPSLWAAVYDIMLVGSFNLHARRIVHGLFVHAICSIPDLDLVDSLSSS